MTPGFDLLYEMISLEGLAYFAFTDPKRRRVAELPQNAVRPFIWLARAAVFLPGFILLLIADWSGLAIWAGMITVLGWIMAAIQPADYARAVMWSRQRTTEVARFCSDYSKSAVPAARASAARLNKTISGAASGFAGNETAEEKMSVLQTRVAALEARLDQLEEERIPETGNRNQETDRQSLERARARQNAG